MANLIYVTPVTGTAKILIGVEFIDRVADSTYTDPSTTRLSVDASGNPIIDPTSGLPQIATVPGVVHAQSTITFSDGMTLTVAEALSDIATAAG